MRAVPAWAEEAKQMRSRGMTFRQIAEALHCSHTGVWQRVTNWGALNANDGRYARNPRKVRRDEEALALYERGVKSMEIATRLGYYDQSYALRCIRAARERRKIAS